MNILFVGHEDQLNGASKSLLNIISVLKNEPKNVIHVLTAYSSGPFYDELRKLNVEILVKPYHRWCLPKGNSTSWIKSKLRWSLQYRFLNKITAKEVAKYIKQHSIEIVHVNSSVINIGAEIKRYTDVKLVWHFREFGDLDFNMAPLVSKRSFYSTINKYADKIICISNAIEKHYSIVDGKKKIVVYNGVDDANIIQNKQYSQGIVRFLIAGRIEHSKGQEDAIKACEYLIEKGINSFKLFVAGTGDLKLHISEPLKANVQILGQVKNMPCLRENIDVELVCSRAEAFGRVTVEAMLGGSPVIGSNTGGTPELVSDGETGFLYEYKNIEALAKKMQYFIDHQEIIPLMGNNAQRYALKNFLIERCVYEIERVYEEVLGK